MQAGSWDNNTTLLLLTGDMCRYEWLWESELLSRRVVIVPLSRREGVWHPTYSWCRMCNWCIRYELLWNFNRIANIFLPGDVGFNLFIQYHEMFMRFLWNKHVLNMPLRTRKWMESYTYCQHRTEGRAPSQCKDGLSRYDDFHYKDKTVVRWSYLYNGNLYTDNMTSLYWYGPQILCGMFTSTFGDNRTSRLWCDDLGDSWVWCTLAYSQLYIGWYLENRFHLKGYFFPFKKCTVETHTELLSSGHTAQ